MAVPREHLRMTPYWLGIARRLPTYVNMLRGSGNAPSPRSAAGVDIDRAVLDADDLVVLEHTQHRVLIATGT